MGLPKAVLFPSSKKLKRSTLNKFFMFLEIEFSCSNIKKVPHSWKWNVLPLISKNFRKWKPQEGNSKKFLLLWERDLSIPNIKKFSWKKVFLTFSITTPCTFQPNPLKTKKIHPEKFFYILGGWKSKTGTLKSFSPKNKKYALKKIKFF